MLTASSQVSLFAYRTVALIVAIATALPAAFGATPATAAASPNARFYAATGHSVGGAFLTFFDRYGGLRIFGYPLSDEVIEDGRPVQYFERQRFEYHKELAGTPNEVQLSRLGALMLRNRAAMAPVAAFPSTASRIYVRETGHSLGSPFLAYWRANGGVRVLGYPITEPVQENGRTVQYFERARMERHPSGVLLGLLGKEYVQTHPEVAARVGAPSTSGQAPAAPAAPAARPLSALEQELINRINGARQTAGLAPVRVDGQLNAIALERSRDMAAKGYFSHYPPDGRNYVTMIDAMRIPFKYAGEIIARNNWPGGETAMQAYEGFMASPGHRGYILHGPFTLAGVGEVTDASGYHFFTVIFIEQ